MATQKTQIKYKFKCEPCRFYTNNNYDFKRHNGTKKHEKTVKYARSSTALIEEECYVCDCGKFYKERTGLWRHKKKCDIEYNNEIDTSENDIPEEMTGKEMVLKLIKQNGELQKQIISMSKETKQITNITNQTNHFNLNIFLNEHCKNAVNLIDFVNSLHISIPDLEKTGKVGYVEGLSGILVNALNNMDVTERPIHCTDAKRETVYVKDQDTWQIEDKDRTKLKTTIKALEDKNLRSITTWQEENPRYEIMNTKENAEYINISLNSLGSSSLEESNKQQDKIIKNVLKEVVIDKKKGEIIIRDEKEE
jgi:hypothetical protein|uniref:C2H2-type domain-containing protein n=1 Tax=viral metagenome TaxID=1070528 RepID=A0A6C0IN98_9ZZZZ